MVVWCVESLFYYFVRIYHIIDWTGGGEGEGYPSIGSRSLWRVPKTLSPNSHVAINSLLLPSCIVLSRIIMNHLFSSLLLLVVATFGIIASVDGFATPSLQQLGGISGGKVLRQPFFCEHPNYIRDISLSIISNMPALLYMYIKFHHIHYWCIQIFTTLNKLRIKLCHLPKTSTRCINYSSYSSIITTPLLLLLDIPTNGQSSQIWHLLTGSLRCQNCTRARQA